MWSTIWCNYVKGELEYIHTVIVTAGSPRKFPETEYRTSAAEMEPNRSDFDNI